MVRKPDIQYISQFYVHGSEAQELAAEKPKKPRTKLPLARLEQVREISLDPVAIFGVAVAVILLITMLVGAVHIQDAWEDYGDMAAYVSELKRENARLEAEYRSGYDLEDIRTTALTIGMVPRSELETVTIGVTVPETQEAPSALEEAWEDFLWFLKGLFA